MRVGHRFVGQSPRTALGTGLGQRDDREDCSDLRPYPCSAEQTEELRGHKMKTLRVMLKISPMKDIKRFGKKRKLAPRYIGPFRITEKSWSRI